MPGLWDCLTSSIENLFRKCGCTCCNGNTPSKGKDSGSSGPRGAAPPLTVPSPRNDTTKVNTPTPTAAPSSYTPFHWTPSGSPQPPPSTAFCDTRPIIGRRSSAAEEECVSPPGNLFSRHLESSPNAPASGPPGVLSSYRVLDGGTLSGAGRYATNNTTAAQAAAATLEQSRPQGGAQPAPSVSGEMGGTPLPPQRPLTPGHQRRVSASSVRLKF